MWILLGIYGLALFSESILTSRWSWYARIYIVLQAGLVIVLLYSSPALDFLPLLFFPLSFQAVQYFGIRIGFACIGIFTLAMAGMFFFGLEWAPGILMILLSGTADVFMGSYAHLISRTEKAREKNQRLFQELQEAYRKLKGQAEQQEQLAAARERYRLTRELHDSLTQTLFSMNLAAQSALISFEEAPQQTDEQLARLQNLASSASHEIKSFMSQSSTQPVSTKGLAEALQGLVRESQMRDNLQVTLELSGKRKLLEEVETNLFRIVQEGLNNVVRHASTRQAWVKLCLEEPHASLEIMDKGCGFEAEQVNRTRGFGLAGMRERADGIGWTLEVRSKPGEGTSLSLREKSR